MNLKNSIIDYQKKVNNFSSIKHKYNTPFQLQHLKLEFQKNIIHNKMKQNNVKIEINKRNKNVLSLFKKNKSSFSVNFNNCNKINKRNNKLKNKYDLGKSTFGVNNGSISKFHQSISLKSINNSPKTKTIYNLKKIHKIKPNCYYNKMHLIKIKNKNKIS
jgi:hypothetical protein